MAHLQHFNPSFSFDPPLPPDTKISMSASSYNMCIKGLNFPVQVTGVPLDAANTKPKSVLVMAHLGTGAFSTCIDEKLATALELFPIGCFRVQTESGFKDMKKYIVNIDFPGTVLKGSMMYVVGCDLSYRGGESNLDPNNFSVLLGRDIMANWNIVWNGPTSSAFVSD
ncbi:MAG: hypothetical protein FWG33_02400 [Oscillospiraceae bacterium]|nr:hypothetical protein [Oscillospiraceae bacterium]